MARKANKNERPRTNPSKEWVIEIVASTEPQNRLDRAVELILQAATHGEKPDLGGSGSTGLEVD